MEKQETILTDVIQNSADLAISWFGIYNQIEKAKEEAVEFIAALEEYSINRTDDKKYRDALIDETSDILFMSFQIAKIVGIDRVIARLNYKAGRVIGIIHKEKQQINEHCDKHKTKKNY